ncbi:hypothetical protein [Pseudoalteromonas sp. DY56-GL79]
MPASVVSGAGMYREDSASSTVTLMFAIAELRKTSAETSKPF